VSNNNLRNDKNNLNKGNFFKQKIFYGALVIGICVFAGGTVYLMVNNIINSARDYSSEDNSGSGYLVENNFPDYELENTLTNDLLTSEDDVNGQLDTNSLDNNPNVASEDESQVPSIEVSGGLPTQEDNTSQISQEDSDLVYSTIPKEEISKTDTEKIEKQEPSDQGTTKKNTDAEQKSLNTPENADSEAALNIFKKDTLKNIEFQAPLPGKILVDYSMDKLIYSKTLEEWRTHPGVDIAAPRGTVVCTIGDGVVLDIKKDPRYGITIVVEHDNGFKSIYANLATDDMVSPNQKVIAGDKISCVGNTAIFESAEPAHLHFELYKDEKVVDPKKHIKVLTLSQ